MRHGALHDGLHHGHEADVLLVLQAQYVRSARRALHRNGDHPLRQEALGLQLLAAQAQDQHLAAEVRVQGNVAQGADRDLRTGGESINSLWFIVAALCVYSLAFRFYSAFVATRVLMLDASRATPATHCTVWVIASRLRVPTEPSALR